MSGRARLALVLALALTLLLPPLAAAYGTSTAYVGAVAAAPGSWSGLAAAGDAADAGAAATLTEADAAAVAATVQPANGSFSGSATGWTAAGGSCSGFGCSGGLAYDGAAGDPAGSARVSLSSGLFSASVTGTWRSPSFSWTSGTPATVAFRIDRRADVAQASSASWSVTLVDETDAAGTVVLLDGTLPADAGFTTVAAPALPAATVRHDHAYRIEIATSLAVSPTRSVAVHYDDVTLTVRPVNLRAVGQLTVTGVTPGATTTLETRARTDGEAFDLEVWNGSAWIPRLAVTDTAYANLSYGLTSAERAGGEVRVRAVDRSQGVDDDLSHLLIDHLRVVSTGGVNVSAPSEVTLPPLTIDGVGDTVSSGPLGTVDVVDTGGAPSGWTLSATATPWALAGNAAVTLPATALAVTPGAVAGVGGASLSGISAGGVGTLGATPRTLMRAEPLAGIGTYRQTPTLVLTVPPNAREGVYRSVITLTVS